MPTVQDKSSFFIGKSVCLIGMFGIQSTVQTPDWYSGTFSIVFFRGFEYQTKKLIIKKTRQVIFWFLGVSGFGCPKFETLLYSFDVYNLDLV